MPTLLEAYLSAAAQTQTELNQQRLATQREQGMESRLFAQLDSQATQASLQRTHQTDLAESRQTFDAGEGVLNRKLQERLSNERITSAQSIAEDQIGLQQQRIDEEIRRYKQQEDLILAGIAGQLGSIEQETANVADDFAAYPTVARYADLSGQFPREKKTFGELFWRGTGLGNTREQIETFDRRLNSPDGYVSQLRGQGPNAGIAGRKAAGISEAGLELLRKTEPGAYRTSWDWLTGSRLLDRRKRQRETFESTIREVEEIQYMNNRERNARVLAWQKANPGLIQGTGGLPPFTQGR